MEVVIACLLCEAEADGARLATFRLSARQL
jgi:hypothetical protein